MDGEDDTAARQRRQRTVAGVTPVVLVGGAAGVAAALGRATLTDVVVATVLYGGLLGLVAYVLVHERADGRRCPRCDAVGERRRPSCGSCGYDLVARPRFACDQRHELALEPGTCRCGRRLQQLPEPRGIGPYVRRAVWTGVWLLAFLVGTSVALRALA